MTKAMAVCCAAALGSGCMIVLDEAGPRLVLPMPAMSVIAGTSGLYAVDGTDDVFYYGNYYYRNMNGVWHRSSAWNGGWVTVGILPRVFYSIPVGHPRYHFIGRGHSPSSVKVPAPGVRISPAPSATKVHGAPPVKISPGPSPSKTPSPSVKPSPGPSPSKTPPPSAKKPDKDDDKKH